MARERLRLTFGEGIDRHSGASLADPHSFSDLRNVLLRRGAADVRKGLAQVYSLNDGVGNMTDVLLNAIMEVTRTNIDVGYRSASKKFQLFENNALIDTIATVAATPTSLRYFSAEVNGITFLAHDQPYDTTRIRTRYYAASSGAVTDLTADLNNVSGAQPVEFRGVMAYLNYLVGWGYGTFTDNPREEIVRVSLPGEPLVFKPEHYFIVGARGAPVLNCLPVGGRLLVFKATKIFPIVGTNRANFGVLPASDPDYGLAGSRLACLGPGGDCYFWSQFGPRMTTGGPSTDLALPLRLDAPEPSDLVASGAASDGFAQYIPGFERIRFIFGRRCYTLHLKDPSRPRWSYDEFGVPIRSAGRHYLVAGGDLPNQPSYEVVYGRSGGSKVMHLSGADDDGVAYQASAKTDPVAPGGSDGEAIFYAVTLSVIHTMAATLVITPYVDGVALETKTWALTAKGTATLESREFNLSQPYVPSGSEQSRNPKRGTWFSLKVETTALAAGDLSFEESVVEHEITRDRKVAA
jgi:hypothetical protein